jgi:protein TonB
MKTIILALSVSSVLHAGLLVGYGYSDESTPRAGDTLTISLIDQSAVSRSASIAAPAAAGAMPAVPQVTRQARTTAPLQASSKAIASNDVHGVVDTIASLAGERDRAASAAADSNGERLRRQVSRIISDQFFYPVAAQRRGIEGSVTVRVAIDGTGRISRFDISQGSGYRVLDEAALASIRRAASNSRIFTGHTHAPLEVEFPVRYQLVEHR